MKFIRIPAKTDDDRILIPPFWISDEPQEWEYKPRNSKYIPTPRHIYHAYAESQIFRDSLHDSRREILNGIIVFNDKYGDMPDYHHARFLESPILTPDGDSWHIAGEPIHVDIPLPGIITRIDPETGLPAETTKDPGEGPVLDCSRLNYRWQPRRIYNIYRDTTDGNGPYGICINSHTNMQLLSNPDSHDSIRSRLIIDSELVIESDLNRGSIYTDKDVLTPFELIAELAEHQKSLLLSE